jgi:preprotein translocase subunit SecY
MASAAEQLAANINWGAFTKAEELQRRIWFSLGALIVYRLGTYIPIPGLDPVQLENLMNTQTQGGAIARMAIFALNVMPYISASIILQIFTTVSPRLEALKKEGEAGRKQINQYTRYLTVGLATVQSYGIAVGLQSQGHLVTNPGLFFTMSTVITLTGGVMFLMWLGEQITSRGIGNGVSLIIFAGIVANLWHGIVNTLELVSHGSIPWFGGILLYAAVVVIIVVIVFFERAQRRLLVQYPKRQMGNRMFGGESSHLPLKLNTSGVIPPIFASSLLLAPLSIINLFSARVAERRQPLAPARLAALHAALCRRHRLLLFLLHGHRLQPDRYGRQSEEVRRLHPRHPSGQEDRGLHRLCAHPTDGRRRDLPHTRMFGAGVPL